MTRVIVDANVIISYLLTRSDISLHARIVRAAVLGHFDLIVGITTITEVTDNVSRKPWLRDRIDPTAMGALIEQLAESSEIVVDNDYPIPSVARDRKDDYLLALAMKASIDILVSGDKDLLILDPYQQIRIVSPAELVMLIDSGLLD